MNAPATVGAPSAEQREHAAATGMTLCALGGHVTPDARR